MVSQVIVDIRNQPVEGHAPIERFGIRCRMRPVARKSVDEFRVAPAFAVDRSGHRHRRQKRNTCAVAPIKPT